MVLFGRLSARIRLHLLPPFALYIIEEEKIRFKLKISHHYVNTSSHILNTLAIIVHCSAHTVPPSNNIQIKQIFYHWPFLPHTHTKMCLTCLGIDLMRYRIHIISCFIRFSVGVLPFCKWSFVFKSGPLSHIYSNSTSLG